jgi:hypothetical protein
MRGIVLLVSIVLASVSAGAAQQSLADDSHTRAAAELIELLKLEEGNAFALELMAESMGGQDAAVVGLGEAMIELTSKYLPTWDELYPEYVRIYREAFTEAELRELIAFYRTPLGSKLVELTPQITREASMITQRLMQDRVPELQLRMRQQMGGGW